VGLPALDALLFLHPRKSQVDVVQSLDTVMRRAEGKISAMSFYRLVFPLCLPPEEALNNNEKYKVVWQILNALCSHDDRFNAAINKMDWVVNISDKVVKKCGKHDYWENWANDIARIARTHITRISALLKIKTVRNAMRFRHF
jgi:predicted helicase